MNKRIGIRKLCVVREFDLITDNEGYKELHSEETVHLIESKYYNELKEYIERLPDKGIDEDYGSIFRIGNHGITARNYIGLIQLNSGFQLQVMPKIELTYEDTNTKKIISDMLKSLMNYKGRKFSNTDLKTRKMNVFEIFISMYIEQVVELLNHGLKSSYVSVENNIPFFKGKLKVSDHIKRNITNAAMFYMQYDEYMLNRPENRLIKATLLYLDKISIDSNNSKQIKQLLGAFENIDASKNYQADFSSVSLDRSMVDYFDLMKWSKVFLYNESFTTFSGNNNSISLMFPMDKLFEAYVAKKMKSIFSSDWDVSTQDRGLYLFVEPEEQFSLRPDIVISKASRKVIMDTKWKKLIDKPSKNYGISQADMYQMYAYSKKYEASEIWLLYPANNEMKKYDTLSFNSGDGTLVNVFFVDIARIDVSLLELKNKIEN